MIYPVFYISAAYSVSSLQRPCGPKLEASFQKIHMTRRRGNRAVFTRVKDGSFLLHPAIGNAPEFIFYALEQNFDLVAEGSRRLEGLRSRPEN